MLQIAGGKENGTRLADGCRFNGGSTRTILREEKAKNKDRNATAHRKALAEQPAYA